MNKPLLFFLISYFSVISFVTVVITLIDKTNAKKNRRRVPEKTLMTFALLGGSIAEYVTMKVIRHKTLHKKFMIGLPLIILLQAGGCVFLYLYFFTNIFSQIS
ncbi:MAG: DUF1294 domain-containing protein [Clostridia bacterium]|nr:DUF1294 domain-containing protein [Clostridia bacterium]